MSRLSPHSADRRPYDEKRKLASSIKLDGYYTNGWDLVEITYVSAITGCVEFKDCSHGATRCLDILEFRRSFWLVAIQSNQSTEKALVSLIADSNS